MIIRNAYIKGENRDLQELTMIMFVNNDEIRKSTLKNIIIKRFSKNTNILFSACTIINSQQEKPTRKVIQIGGFYVQSTIPDLPSILIESCLLLNCIIPFENIYMINCVIKKE